MFRPMTSTPSPATAQSDSPEFVTESNGVLTLAVSAAGAGNSLDDDAIAANTQALREVARGQRDVGAVLLVGLGKNFCAGGNVRAFAAADDRPTYLRLIADNFHDFVAALYEAEVPVVVAAKGWGPAGAGMSLVLHADVAIGGSGTKLRLAYRGIVLTPDGGLYASLPRAVGRRARQITLTDRVVSADAGAELGHPFRYRRRRRDRIGRPRQRRGDRRRPRSADSGAKRLLSLASETSLVEHLALEGRSISERSGRPEGIEGVDAFVGKRAPEFGRTR